jgi:hypothetical protein
VGRALLAGRRVGGAPYSEVDLWWSSSMVE